MLRYLTAGESHGQALTAIVEGFPSGVTIDFALIDRELERRQGGYGRGKRQKLETDRIIVDAGIYHGVTTGGPITLRLVNRDAKLERLTEPAAPRGGHIDLAGAINYQTGIRQVLERDSARETALRVAVGALARLLLRELGIDVFGYVVELGGIAAPPVSLDLTIRDASPVYTLNPQADAAIIAAIDAAQEAGDTLGGVIEAIVNGVPDRPGFARPVGPQARRPAGCGRDERAGDQGGRDRPGFRGSAPVRLEGDGPDPLRARSSRRGSPVRLPPADQQCRRNRGGNVQRRADRHPRGKKPISTLAARGPSVNMATKSPAPAAYERSTSAPCRPPA